MSVDGLMDRHKGLAESMARNISRKNSWRYDDTFADAMVGLWQAAKRFDPDRGLKFETFASHKIRGAILDGSRERTKSRLKSRPPALASLDAMVRPSEADTPAPLRAFLADARAEAPGRGIAEAEQAAHLLRGLLPAEREAVRGYVLDGLTLKEIARSRGLKESRLSQLLANSLAWLRESRTGAEGGAA